MGKFYLNNSRRENVRLLVACVAFIAAGVWMIMKGGWYGWVPVLFFGPFLPVIIWQLVGPRPGASVGGRGFGGRTPGGVAFDPAGGEGGAFAIHFDGADEPPTEAARNSMEFLKANEALLRLKVAASMLELYREWHDGEEVTAEELARMIRLHDAEILDEGGGELVYAAGELFAGHWVCAPFDANGEVGEPELEG